MEQIQLQLPLRITQSSSDSSIVCAPEEQQRQRQQQEQQGPSFLNMYDKPGSGSVSRSASSTRDTSNMLGTSHCPSSFNVQSNQEMPSRYDSPISSSHPRHDVHKTNTLAPTSPQLNGTETDGASRPQTPPQEASTTPVASLASASVVHTKFEAVAAHTAKCDLCNTRNDSGMSRCQSCGWQSCHACTISNGRTRTHQAGSRTHTGPIDRGLLVSSPKGKGKKKSQGRAKSQQTRVSKRGRGRDRPQLRAREGAGRKANTPSPSPAATVTPNPSFDAQREQSPSRASKDPSSAVDRDFFEDEKYFQGARDLYAFSLEAYGVWANDQRDRNPAQRWCYHAVRLEELHEHALFSATRAGLEFRRQAVGKGNGVW